MSKCLAFGQDFFPIPTVSHKGSGEGGTVHTWWVQQFCDIFGKKGDARHMLLGDNPVGHGFVLRNLILIELFQISHNFVTEFILQAKFLLKIIQKLLEISFSQYVIFYSTEGGSSNLQACRETPIPSSLPHLVGHPDLPMRKTLRVVAVMIFLTKQKICYI